MRIGLVAGTHLYHDEARLPAAVPAALAGVDRILPTELIQDALAGRFGIRPDVVIYGDTHVAAVVEHQRVVCINPGRTLHPDPQQRIRGGGTVGILDLDGRHLSARILDLNHGFPVFAQGRCTLRRIGNSRSYSTRREIGRQHLDVVGGGVQAINLMEAVAVTPGLPGSARLVEVRRPVVPGPGEALVRVLHVGICGTDVEITSGLYGEAPPGENFLILGHESFGVVEAVGPGVSNLMPGDYVAAIVRRPDDCLNCRNGEWDMCSKGAYRERGIRGLHGFMRPYYVEQAEYLVRVPPELRHVGVLMEPLSIVEKGLTQISRIQGRLLWEPKTAVVLGAGPIGLLATAGFRASGYQTFTVARATAPNLRADLVAQMGGVYISVQDTSVADLAQGLGQIDVMFEATGNSAVAFEALQSLGTNGILCLTSVTPGDRHVQVPSDAINLRMVLGNMVAFGIVNANRSHFEEGVRHLALFEQLWPGTVPRIITQRFPLAEFAAAMEQHQERDSIKVVLDLEG